MMNVKSGQVHIDAKHNIQKTWRELLALASVLDRNEPLTVEILEDPLHPIVLVLINLYTHEGFVYRILNEASRVADETKLKSMGPYA